MNKIIESIQNYFIGESLKQNEQEYRKVRILINTTLITSLFALFFLSNTVLFEMPHAFGVMLGCALLFALNAFLIKWGVNRFIVTHLYVMVASAGTFLDCYYSGGLYSFNVVWFALGPVCAVLLGDSRTGWIWLSVSLTLILVLGIMQINGYPFPFEMNLKFKDYMYLNSFLGLGAIVFTVMVIMENASVITLRRLEEQNEIIKAEKKRSDDLLLNILPNEIVTELKATGHSKAKLFNHVTVFFSDFVNFTHISEDLNPEELVNEIDFYFKAFDDIIERNGLEKIKTIGDAYLAVCGLPNEDEDHASKVVKASIEIIEFTEQRKREGGKFELRIGIHSGPLVAGIVGVKKFAYDVWGDTVNTASRMETCGEVGKINISKATYDLVKDKFNFTPRGKIEVKNKGEVEMFFVETRFKPSPSHKLQPELV